MNSGQRRNRRGRGRGEAGLAPSRRSKPSSFSLYSSSPPSHSLLVFLIDLGSASARSHLLRPPQTKNTKNRNTCYTVRLTCQESDEKREFALQNTVEALLTDTLVNGLFYLRPPSQNSIFLTPIKTVYFLVM